ncbi:Bifunctional thiamine biosynthesis protein ThiDN [Candidatus Burarchaeum australiense]|nr:Bifunctional thiamine biosynthesis protein ThiDN [Candidatus Burarchaeum australiense]
MTLPAVPTVLSIAASDPDGCAGLAADLRTFYSLGVHGCVVVTAATVQNTKSFSSAFAISPPVISSQIDAVFSDVAVQAVKIGLIVGEGNVRAVADSLRKWKAKNIVLDPIMSAQPDGKWITERRTADAIRKYLVPLATFITPNQDEAFALTGVREPKKAAISLRSLGAKNVIVKGLRLGSKIGDYAFISGKPALFTKPFIRTGTHGGGCVFSSALAAYLAKGMDVREALEAAERFITSSIANSWKPGKGIAAVEPLGSPAKRKVLAELSDALALFETEQTACKLIPEIGTNLVYSLPNAKSTGEVAGVVGRVRHCGTFARSFGFAGRAECARSLGIVDFGASSHVARMLLEFARHFKGTRAAINLVLSPQIVRACRKVGLRTVVAEREKEPAGIAGREGKSLQGLVGETLRNSRTIPDAIFFTGSVGKEPSTVIFGRSPADVVRKAIKIARELD